MRGNVLRGIVAVLFALLAVVQIVRAAIVADNDQDVKRLAAVWPTHPQVLSRAAILGVAQAGVEGRHLDAATEARIAQLTKSAPLASEPFVIHAALAQREGRWNDAERLLVEARTRNPRNPGARYLLASNYLTNGKTLEALREMVVIPRLVNGPSSRISPMLVAYAQTPGAVATLRKIFAENPELEPLVLDQLVNNPANADLVMALASRSTSVEPPVWQATMLTTLIEAGQYDKAHALWRALSGFTEAHSIFNPQFAPINAPPPFNWRFAQDAAGVVEPRNGELSVLYFGREDAALATQVLQLLPGNYQIASRASGDLGSPGSLRWTLHCLPKREPLLDTPLTKAGPYVLQFQVPAACQAQQLQLRGTSQDFDARVDARIGGLQLRKIQ